MTITHLHHVGRSTLLRCAAGPRSLEPPSARAALANLPVRLFCGALLLLISACSHPSTEQEEPILRIQTEVARTEALSNRILTSAQTEASAWSPLYFAHPGRVRKVYVEENQVVRPGQLMAEQETAVQITQVEKSELSLKRAVMEEEQTLHDLENMRSLAANGGASEEQLHDQEQHLLEVKLQREQSELNLKREQLRLEQLRLVAPFAGVVTEVNIRDGDLAIGPVSDPDRAMNARPPIVVTNPDSPRTIRAHLPEGRAQGVHVGTPVEATLMEHRDIVLMGKVVRVSGTVDRDTRTVTVQVDLTQPDDGYPAELRDGSAALVAFLTDRRANAVTVSEFSLYYYQNRAFVFVVKNNSQLERRPVKLGLFRSGRIEISEGLEPGERIARSNLYLLQDGQTVTTEDRP